jgi:hypothetical protein
VRSRPSRRINEFTINAHIIELCANLIGLVSLLAYHHERLHLQDTEIDLNQRCLELSGFGRGKGKASFDGARPASGRIWPPSKLAFPGDFTFVT